MKSKIYYLLFILLVFIGLFVTAVLVRRADQADKFFEYQKSQKEKQEEQEKNFDGQ
jgi:hypothetical protein